MTITAGTLLGPYEITARIGAGGMGEVYRAHDRKLNRDVALKVLPEAFTNDPDRLARFSREAHLLAALNHPHIASIYGLEDGAETRALVLELVEGDTLADRIARGPIPVPEALPIARQIADALQAAHDQGIVHRDLKPANIKITPDDVVKVLDFGLAKLGLPERAAGYADVTMSPTITSPALLTTAGLVLGTAAYMSPEQAKGREADKRSDIWAFGCVLFEMLTGQRPFDGEDMTDVLGAVVRLEPNWDLLPADVPPAIRTLLQQCLVKDRRRRVADIAAARFVLDHHAAAFDPIPPAMVRADKRAWPRVAAISIAVLAAAVTGAALMWWFLGRAAPPRVVRSTIATAPSAAVDLSTLGRVVAFTPDGSRVVYQARSQLMVRPLDDEPSVLARGSFRAIFMSPDGQWVGFWDRGMIKRVAITGGPIESVVEVQGDIAGATWGPDGTLVFATAAPGIGLQRLPPGGSKPTELTKLAPTERDHVLPEFLPGGDAVLFTIFPTVGGVDNTQIAVLDLRTGASKTLMRGSDPHYVATGHLVYTVGGTLRAIAFDVERRETRGQSVLVLDGVATTRVGVAQAAISTDGSLVYVPGPGGARRTVASIDRNGTVTPLPNLPSEIYRQVRVSPDGRRFATSVGGDIRIFDFARATANSLTTEAASETNPLWTPDNRRIFFTSLREGFPQIYSRLADGTGGAELVLSRGKDLTNLVAAAWASKTRLIFMEVPSDLQARLGQIDLDRPGDVTMLPIQGARPAVSQYGIAYESNTSGQYEIFVERFPQLGNREKIAVGRDPRWSVDGRELFFVSEDGRQILSAKVQPGALPSLRQPEVVVTAEMIPTQGGDSGYDVAPGGFVVIRNEGAGSGAAATPTLELIQHWTEGLKRLVPAN